MKPAAIPSEYSTLREKIDDFFSAVAKRRTGDLMCRSSCAACCHVELSISNVEAAAIRAHVNALSKEERAALKAALAQERLEDPTSGPRCAMLRSDDTCAIYAVRPLVCRSQGLPLIYPQELVPKSARRGVTADGRALVVCPLNFRDADRPPSRDDILNAEHVDVVLSLVNRRFVEREPGSTIEMTLTRVALSDLKREFVENL